MARGIRCEKAASYIKDSTDNSQIYMLEGGIHSYLEWIKSSESESSSLFKGSNYVFDARVVSPGVTDPVSFCNCGKPSDRYEKCTGFGCHLMVVNCLECSVGAAIFCCEECESKKEGEKLICSCERKRRSKLLVFDPAASVEE